MNRLASLLAALFLAAFPAVAQQGHEPGRFDYYVLSLSWSPTWCGSRAGRDDVEQCGGLRRYGFVVHGLWPQYEKGGFPAKCSVPSPLPPKLVEDMLPLMPSRKLVEHEWAKHGTCASADPATYFGTTKAARDKLRIPEPLSDPTRAVTLSVPEIQRMFTTANPGLEAGSVAVTCRGRQVAEIRVCLTRDLNFRRCGRDVESRCGRDVMFPAAR